MYGNQFHNRPLTAAQEARRAKNAKAAHTRAQTIAAKKALFLEDPANAQLVADLEAATSNKHDSFFDSLLRGLNLYGNLSEKQIAAARTSLAKRAEWAAEREAQNHSHAGSQFVGNVGERKDFELKLERVFSYESAFGTGYGQIMTDRAGNVLAYFGNKLDAKVGQTIEMAARIKKHEARDGVKQTLLSHPKVFRVEDTVDEEVL